VWEVARGPGSELEAVEGRWGRPPPRQTPTLPPMPPRLSKNPLMLISSQAYRLPSTATLLLKQWSVPTWKKKKKKKKKEKRKEKEKKKERKSFCGPPLTLAMAGQPLDRSDHPKRESPSFRLSIPVDTIDTIEALRSSGV